jgi:hypothetical protein
VQQKMATAAAGTAQQEEEVEHGPFPIEQLQVRNRLAPETLLGFLALLLFFLQMAAARFAVRALEWEGG